MTDLELPMPLVPTEWLAAHLADRRVRVLDATTHLPNTGRDARAEYEAAHIPGAVFADLTWLSDAAAPFPHTLPDSATFGSRVGALGVAPDHLVVVYDSSGQNFSAPRVWWMLRIYGHARVAVLDGGLPKWRAEGRSVTSDVPVVVSQAYAATLDASRVRDIGMMRENLDTKQSQVVDARSPGRFTAAEPEPRAGVRGGHIPGSVNVHYATLVNADGTMRAPDELRAIMDAAGLNVAAPIVASCGTGVTACAVVLALETIGATNTAVFDGSWTEWGSHPDTPVETGPAQRR